MFYLQRVTSNTFFSSTSEAQNVRMTEEIPLLDYH